MLTPAIRAIYFPSSAPQGPMPHLIARKARSQTKNRRAHECAAGLPVDRDERQIGFAPGRVKGGETHWRRGEGGGVSTSSTSVPKHPGRRGSAMTREILLFQR